jgi:peptide/nickel transport system ATP-binding protein
LPDPERRSLKRIVDISEPQSALRPVDFNPIYMPLTRVSEGHFVREA